MNPVLGPVACRARRLDGTIGNAALAAGIEHAADRIGERLHRRMGDIDHHKVGFGAWRDPPQIVAAQRGSHSVAVPISVGRALRR